MSTGANGGITTAIHRALTSVAMFAQVMLLFAPLIDVQDTGPGHRAFAVGMTTPGIATMGSPRESSRHHDAATCPACIAQSLHAQLVASVRLPTLTVAERAPSDRRIEVLPHHDPP